MDGSLMGQCFCGTVKYAVDADPIWCAHCHCSMCRQAHGAAFVTWFGVPYPAFRVYEGEQALHWFQSSAQAKRGFCGQCGTPLFFHGQRWADEMHISRASLTLGEVMPPSGHVYYDSHVGWANCNDGLPRYGSDGGVIA